MMFSLFYQPTFIKDLKIIQKPNRVSITGVITAFKTKEKFVLFTVDDNTGTVLCLYFKDPQDKTKFSMGSLITVKGEYELNRFFQEDEYRVKVHKYTFLKDVNEELYSYLEILMQTNLKVDNNVKMEVEQQFERKDFIKSPSKRIPLSKESVSIKLRTLIFRCLREQVERVFAHADGNEKMIIEQPHCYVTFLDILGYKPLSDFVEKENVSGKYDISKAILDLEKIMLIQAIPQHSQEEYEGVKYEINYDNIVGLKERILECIKNTGTIGIRVEELHKVVNSIYSAEIFILSTEYVWQIADELFNENKIFLSGNNVLHYFDKLYA